MPICGRDVSEDMQASGVWSTQVLPKAGTPARAKSTDQVQSQKPNIKLWVFHCDLGHRSESISSFEKKKKKKVYEQRSL